MSDQVPFLMMKFTGNVYSPAVYAVYPNGRLELIGNPDFEAGVTPDTHCNYLNRVIDWEGDKYGIHNGKIYRLIGDTWTLDGGAANTARPDTFQYGFQPVVITGVPYLFVPQSVSAYANFGVRYKVSPNVAAGAWLEEAQTISVNDTAGDGTYFDNISFGNSFYQQAMDTINPLAEVTKFNFELRHWSVIPHAANPASLIGSGDNIYGPCSFGVYNNKLYELMFGGTNNSSAVPQTIWLQEVEGNGAFGSMHALTLASGLKAVTNVSDNTVNDRNYGRTTMFTDENEQKLYVFAIVQSGHGSNDGWAIFEVEEASGQLTLLRDVGPNVLPANILFGNQYGDREMRERFWSYSTVNESGNQVVYLEYGVGIVAQDPHNWYRWNGPDTAATFLGVQPAHTWGRPTIRHGEGNKIDAARIPATFSFSVIPSGSPATNPGTMTLSTRVHGSGQPIELFFLFDDDRETNLTRANIFSSNSGLVDEAGKRIVEVHADGQEILCQWRAQSDGIVLDKDFTIMPMVNVTGVV